MNRELVGILAQVVGAIEVVASLVYLAKQITMSCCGRVGPGPTLECVDEHGVFRRGP